ncbi:hypothetical protein DFH08DRAFT_808796 [Mycena albidolilacea]|uniref:Uncharacterized protein n=1 Tax=Mycena albidolilacea TaxID=1033008 RepID=A0AAD7A257_9AGAR|nr:hypothetical protein DFH08DRAFT_808796 [Mycena albidolilacea]
MDSPGSEISEDASDLNNNDTDGHDHRHQRAPKCKPNNTFKNDEVQADFDTPLSCLNLQDTHEKAAEKCTLGILLHTVQMRNPSEEGRLDGSRAALLIPTNGLGCKVFGGIGLPRVGAEGIRDRQAQWVWCSEAGVWHGMVAAAERVKRRWRAGRHRGQPGVPPRRQGSLQELVHLVARGLVGVGVGQCGEGAVDGVEATRSTEVAEEEGRGQDDANKRAIRSQEKYMQTKQMTHTFSTIKRTLPADRNPVREPLIVTTVRVVGRLLDEGVDVRALKALWYRAPRGGQPRAQDGGEDQRERNLKERTSDGVRQDSMGMDFLHR